MGKAVERVADVRLNFIIKGEANVICDGVGTRQM
jgi:hypothetical protein